MLTRRLAILGVSIAAAGLVLQAASPAQGRPLGPAEPNSSASAAGRQWSLAGKQCRLIALPPVSVPLTLPVGLAEACPGVRPGAAFLSPGGRCTMNFMWKGNDGATYMGTAGHCILERTEMREAKWAAGAGPVATDVNRRPIGRFSYAVLTGDHDFALIRLDPSATATASPRVCHLAGPTGLNADPIPPLAILSHVGQGNITGTLIPARTQIALDTSDPEVVVGLGAAASGDSGSPVLTADGRAAGVLVATGPSLGLVAATGLVLTTRLAPQLARATQVTGITYTLQTA